MPVHKEFTKVAQVCSSKKLSATDIPSIEPTLIYDAKVAEIALLMADKNTFSFGAVFDLFPQEHSPLWCLRRSSKIDSIMYVKRQLYVGFNDVHHMYVASEKLC